MRCPPLYGGGLLVALAQVAVVYYAVAATLHCVVPWLLRPPSIQPAPRRAGQAWREARNSIGTALSLRYIRLTPPDPVLILIDSLSPFDTH